MGELAARMAKATGTVSVRVPGDDEERSTMSDGDFAFNRVCEQLAEARTCISDLRAELAVERVKHGETLEMWRKYDVLLQRIHERLGIDDGDEDSILPALEEVLTGSPVSPSSSITRPKPERT